MYELKTLLPQFEIQLPTCMYTLRNVSLAGDAANVVGSNSHDDSSLPNNAADQSDAAAVAERQNKLLQQLNELRQQLFDIRSKLGMSQTDEQQIDSSDIGKSTNAPPVKEEPLHDIVINAHPRFIPYALLALKNVWRNLFNIDVKAFTHSTMPDIGAEAIAFEKQLTQRSSVQTTKANLKVTLIWKNCEHTEMICSPTMFVPIYGEVNIIRYLGRIGPTAYRYEDSPFCNEIDITLDICYELLRCTTAKSRASLVRTLSNRLQKQTYFGGNEISIADIAVHSSLKRMPSIKEQDLSSSLLEWCKRVQPVTMI